MGALGGKVAIVTGSSSGIGMAIARSLHAEGVTVVVNSATSVEAGTALADELGSTYVQADVSDGEQADRSWRRPSRRTAGWTSW
jgi:ketoreductase RED2